MNLAIIIGVSDYQYVDKLPGCVNDAKAFKYLLDASDKYTEILYIAENTESKIVKQKISSFVKKYESDNIEEVLFYFTGHGLFDENNFYYVLSDFKLENKNQTALQNSELDALLKSLSANVTIKIVDACQSGTRYVKNPEVFSKYLHEAQREFNKCYFMFSSQNDQYSYQSEKISDFTHAFLTSCIARPDQDIRYKDILDSITDSFISNPNQTPYFVTQCNYTEIFSKISAHELHTLNELINGNAPASTGMNVELFTLADLIRKEADIYCSEDEAMSSVLYLKDKIFEYNYNSQMVELFDFEKYEHIDQDSTINTDFIGNYFQNTANNYLININRRAETRQVPKKYQTNWMASIAMMSGKEIELIDETYYVPSGARSKINMPYKQIEINATSKYPNLEDNGMLVIPFLSKTKIIFFSVMFQYKSDGWDKKSIVTPSFQWQVYECLIKQPEKIDAEIDSIMKDFEFFTIEPLKKRFSQT